MHWFGDSRLQILGLALVDQPRVSRYQSGLFHSFSLSLFPACSRSIFFLNFEKAAPIAYSHPMNRSPSPIPWNTPVLWQEANFAICHAVERHSRQLMEARRIAIGLQEIMSSVFRHMEHLCGATCPSCREVCCRHACVWMDYKDLIFLHLTGTQIPPSQPLSHRGERCRHLGPTGCRLDRIQRPFICTWYLCPAQKRCMSENPAHMNRIGNGIQQVKSLRNKMEYHFISAIA